MKCCAVVDTNVIVSALLSKKRILRRFITPAEMMAILNSN